MRIKLSLICPMYKVVKYLPDLIDSFIIAANTESIEIIFVDDCCPENSYLACNNYIEENSSQIKFQYKILRLNINGGLSTARNKGLLAAKGSYIGFIDSDDVLLPMYWKVLGALIATEPVDIIEFGYKEFSELTDFPENLDVNFNKPFEVDALQPFRSEFFAWLRIYRAELLEDHLFVENVTYEDIAFVGGIYTQANRILLVDVELVGYRQRLGSITNFRDSSYSFQLENLVTTYTGLYKDGFFTSNLLELLFNKSLVILLKGLRIKSRYERRLFFQNSRSPIFSLRELFPVKDTWRLKCQLWVMRSILFFGRIV